MIPVTERIAPAPEAPGNDAISSTAIAAAGATVLLFTTGRGTPLGFPAPTLKISSNSSLAQAKPRWIDFDAGSLLSGTSMDDLAAALLSLVLDTASGRLTCAERNGEREVAIWRATLPAQRRRRAHRRPRVVRLAACLS